jgi:hypothetical protein
MRYKINVQHRTRHPTHLVGSLVGESVGSQSLLQQHIAQQNVHVARASTRGRGTDHLHGGCECGLHLVQHQRRWRTLRELRERALRTLVYQCQFRMFTGRLQVAQQRSLVKLTRSLRVAGWLCGLLRVGERQRELGTPVGGLDREAAAPRLVCEIASE